MKKLEGDYDQKLQDLSQEKEQLASSKQEREKENQSLQEQLGSLQNQVHTDAHDVFFVFLTNVTLITFFQFSYVNC